MEWSQPWFVAAVVGLIAVFGLNLAATLLDLRRFRSGIPPLLRGHLTHQSFDRAHEYAIASAQRDVVADTSQLVALLLFWWFGGFGWLDGLVREWTSSTLLHSVLLIALFGAASSLLNLPFEIWETFGVEARFGFNRTTWRTFASDRLKGAGLAILVGLPVLALIVWFFLRFELAALWSWLFVVGFGALMNWLSPRLIMPLFLKFEPLEDGPLRSAIMAMAERLQFPVKEVSVVDGSRRSTKANAFFAGFGSTRRIALFDTLVKDHEPDGVLAVLAHEIGHGRLGHIPKLVALSAAESGLMFFTLAWVLASEDVFAAFGLSLPSVGAGMLIFSILFKPLSTLLGLGSMWLSRKHEFEADAFASKATGGPTALSDSLTKLSTDHLAHPRPHPLSIWLHHSHPPLVDRLRALRSSG